MAEGMQGLQMEVQLCIIEGSQAKLKETYERHGKLLTNILQHLENLLSAEGSTRKSSQANHVVVERGLWRCSIPTNGDVRSTPSKFDRHCPNDSTVVSTDDKNGKNAKEILTELGKAYPDKATTIVAKRSRVQNETTFFGAGGSLVNIWGCAFAKSKPSCQSPETATVTPPLHGDKDQASQLDPSQKFKLGTYHVLVATDVAAHGLNIKSVVNFDVAILVINAFVCAFEVGMGGNGEGKIKKHAQLIRCVGGEHKIIAIATTCKLEEIALSDQASLHSNPSTLDEYGKAPNGGQRIHLLPFPNPSLPMQPRSMDPSKDSAAYGYGSIAWKERMKSWKQKQEKLQVMRNENGGEDWDNEDDGPDLPLMDEARQPLPRKMPIPSSQINPNRINTGDSSGDPPSPATRGGGGEESGDRRRRDGSVQQHSVHVNRALPAIFFRGSGDLLLRRDRSPLLLSSPVTARRREQQKSGPLSARRREHDDESSSAAIRTSFFFVLF
ncbi:hypothetical protein MRB53_016413 [Persea americana]|uniref:Uncharacterized protein n=1 Tax=Persea americana TaxID=3435 RepID=A0ACC2M327_PERAE|nr:hypothetical protein MRB53_016413 [Persea americana]